METCTQKVKKFQTLIHALRISTEGLKTFVDQCFEDLCGRLKRKVGERVLRIVANNANQRNGAPLALNGNERQRN